MSNASSVPAVPDPFPAGSTPGLDPDDQPLVFSPDHVAYEYAKTVAGLTKPAQLDQLADLIQGGTMVPGLKAQVEALTKIEASVKASNAELTAERDSLQLALHTAASQPKAAESKPLVADDGKPCPHASIPGVDPWYSPLVWFKPVGERLAKRWAQDVQALMGLAGCGKTYGIIQWCAQTKTGLVLLNAKSTNPYDWFCYRSINGKGGTEWTPGKLFEVCQWATQHPMHKLVLLLDEFDTCAMEFQMKAAEALEANADQRRIQTEAGELHIPENVQLVLTCNANGTNPAGRHQGRIASPIINRSRWTRVPTLTAVDIEQVLSRTNPACGQRKQVAQAIQALMALSKKGVIDVDISIRTARAVCDDFVLYNDWKLAWEQALLNSLDDENMAQQAVGAIKTAGLLK